MCEFTADSVTRSRRDSTPNFAPPENFVHVDRYAFVTRIFIGYDVENFLRTVNVLCTFCCVVKMSHYPVFHSV